MREACVKAVDRHGKTYGKDLAFYPLSTTPRKGLDGLLIFAHNLYAVYTPLSTISRQAFGSIFNLLACLLYTFSTLPISNTNLIKD
jgi:hypothetical protein